MDITVEVMLPPRDASDFSQEKVGTHRVMTVVAVYDHKKVVETVGMQRTGYIHVTGVPDKQFARLADLLNQPYLVPGPEGMTRHERKTWRIEPDRCSEALRARMISTRQCDRSWDQFKALLRDQATGGDFSDEALTVRG